MVMGMPSTVMDQLPTPRDISMVFVKQYYTLLNEAPDHVHRFYSQDSSFVHGGLERGKKSETKTAMGQKEINDRIQKLQFRDARTKIKQVDAHPTLAGGVVIQVSGQLSNNGAPMRPFMQTFVLAPQTTHNYYVYNDIFRYQDDLFSDDEDAGDGAADADDAEPESPPVPPPAAPAPAPAQPAAPPAEQPSAAAPTPYGQHMNGHGAAAPAPAPAPVEQQPTPPASPPPAPVAEPESQPEPESPPPPPPRQPSPPPPRQPSPPPVSTEPKTYANLLKASSGRPAAPRPAPPAASPATAAPAAQTSDKDQSPPSRAPAARPTSAAGASRPPPPRDQTSDSGAASGGGGDGERRRYNVYPDNQQIFVGNLPLDVSEAELIEHFGTFGEVIGVRIHTSKAPPTKGLAPRNCPNYSFVVFDNPNAVNQVMQDMPARMVRTGTEEELRLNIERKQQQRPPPGRGDRPMMEGGGRGRGFYSRGAPRGRGGGYGRGGGGEARGGGRGGSYQAAPRR